MNINIRNTVYRSGAGVPLILLHAFPVDHRMWGECAREVIRQCDERGLEPMPVWAPDMPGAGDAPIPDDASSGPVAEDGAYAEALDRLAEAYVSMLHARGFSKAIWVGLSMGGYLALDIQRLYPGSVAGLALCDTTTAADSPQARSNRLAVGRQCVGSDTVEPVMHFASPQPGDSTVKRGMDFQRLLAGWIREQTPEGVAWRERMAAGRRDMADVLATVTAPALLVSGENDPSSPPKVMRPFVEKMMSTDSCFVAIPDCGHFSAVERPAAVAEALVGLVAREQAGDKR
ncbi:alpha/beta hydrolase [Bifidobacterium sp. ESL0790]|uniref:alpha/beta fold hydrolase n=1 Tax=Bifidobacterium sp. ESL0790 TaxID=2983233 RepID=UPI0023F90CEC|nr:alpha/beta hydrolase [Bifidobacterium sp. ESL0790]WEV73242.1 alpha/beta hydrolase [Bifidobacterium sp. ESL0790]